MISAVESIVVVRVVDDTGTPAVKQCMKLSIQ